MESARRIDLFKLTTNRKRKEDKIPEIIQVG